MHPDDRDGATQVASRPRTRTAVRKRWRPWQKHLLGVGIAWLIGTVAGWTGLAYYQLLDAWQHRALAAAIGSLLLIVWVWLGFPGVGKRWKRRTRKAWRRLR